MFGDALFENKINVLSDYGYNHEETIVSSLKSIQETHEFKQFKQILNLIAFFCA